MHGRQTKAKLNTEPHLNWPILSPPSFTRRVAPPIPPDLSHRLPFPPLKPCHCQQSKPKTAKPKLVIAFNYSLHPPDNHSHHSTFALASFSTNLPRTKNLIMSTAPEANGATSPPAKRIKTIPLDDDEKTLEASVTPLAAAEEAPAKTTMEASVPLHVKKLSPQGRLPTRGSAFAAGYDVYAARDTVVPARGKALVDTDISIAVPAGTCKSPQGHDTSGERTRARGDTQMANRRENADGRIAPRSGLASKHFIDTGAGVIDADYRGPVKVLLFNHADADYEIKEGDRIAQLVLERIVTPDVVEVEELEESVRGAGGFGSTGKN